MVFLAEGTERGVLAPAARRCWPRAAGCWSGFHLRGGPTTAAATTRPRSSSPTPRPPGCGWTCGPAPTSCTRPTTGTPCGCSSRAATPSGTDARRLEGLDLVGGRACRSTWSGTGDGLVLLGQPHLGVGAAAVVEGDDPAVVVGVAVGADAERARTAGRRCRTRKPQVVQQVGRRLGERRVGAAVAVVPPLGGEVAALEREGADPAQAEVLGDRRGPAPCRRRRAGRRRRSTSAPAAGRPPRRAAGRRARGRRAGSARGRAPTSGATIASSPGISTTSSTVTAFWRRRAGHGDRPAPADVAGAGAGEEVGDDALALDEVAEVLADVGGVDLVEQRGAGRVRPPRRRRRRPWSRSGGHHGRNHGP